MKLPIGMSDFRKIIEGNYYFSDKSLLIKEILDDTEVILITRPRRFGKTLNMSMLRYFFAKEILGEAVVNPDLFKGLNIADCSIDYLQHQNKYPVVFLTFKDVKDSHYEKFYESFCKLLSVLYDEHVYLLDSSKLHEHDKVQYQAILNQTASFANVQTALQDLIRYLYRHHGVKPMVLIDEYDTPIQSGYVHGYYDKVIELFRHFLGAALKDNAFLFKAVLTGILRVSKESLFSGLNNIKVYSVLNPRYGGFFGFTESEVGQLLENTQLLAQATDIKNWYNGYQIGEYVLYNPWSILCCVDGKGLLKPYWINTSDNALIKQLFLKSRLGFKERFEDMLQDKPIRQIIDENFVFPDLDKYRERAVWNLLLLTGYLKVVKTEYTEAGALCQLAIPNREIRSLFREIIEQWLANGFGFEWYSEFIHQLLHGDIANFTQGLQEVMQQTASFHDLAKEPEAFYHGLILGLTASLHGHPQYEIRSNRESGKGRYDYAIIARDPDQLSLILEFKKASDAELTSAESALQQIDKLDYVTELKQRGNRAIMGIGIAFSGKRFEVAHTQLSR
jgi:Predicted AAA-ATPase/PD-(D/E)XK nuclease superfamily